MNPADSPTVMRRDVVIIEDDSDLRSLMDTVLSKAGYQTTAYPNGDEVLRGNSFASLYVIDLDLGPASGAEICKHIKANQRVNNPSVIIISANPDGQKLGAEVSADGTLNKPFQAIELLSMITECIAKKSKTIL
jgi:DNA-binding response OmpR family regulator